MSPVRDSEKDRYPPDWPEISYRIRFVRAEGRCECEGECGRGTHDGRCPNRHLDAAYGTGSRVILTTAHLNLKAMCQACHLHYDRGHHRETRARTRAVALDAAGQGMFTPDVSIT